MAFGFGREGAKRGGKKGMRQNNGSKRNTTKLKPVPAKRPTHHDDQQGSNKVDLDKYPQSRPLRDPAEPNSELQDEAEAGQDDEEEEDEGFTYQDGLKVEKKPLEGSIITVSGCGSDKRHLMQLASELGAVDSASLSSDTTHLIADVFGSAKCDMALKCNMNIMSPQWLQAVQEAWTSAEVVDFAELEDKYRLPPLSGAFVSLTQFKPGYQESEMAMMLEAAGATVETRLTRSTTHLVVASMIPGQGVPLTNKLTLALRTKELPNLKIVWEGWVRDAIRRGGRTDARDTLWKYKTGQPEPEDLPDTDINPIKRSSGRTSFGGNKSQSARSTRPFDGTSTGNQAGEDDERSVLVRRKTAKLDNDTLLASMSIKPPPLISSVWAAPSSTRLEEAEDTAAEGELPAPNEIGRSVSLAKSESTAGLSSKPVAGPSRLPMESANHDDTFALRANGGLKQGSGSIIKALSSTRSSRFQEQEEANATMLKPRKVLINRRSTEDALRSDTKAATAQDDSAFFEDDSRIIAEMEAEKTDQDEDEPEVPIFEGKTFSLMSMLEVNRKNIQRAVEVRKGRVLVDVIQKTTDYIVVEGFGAPSKYFGPDADSRIVTGFWIENCLFEDRILEFADRLLERPLPYQTPIEGAELLKVHLSGFADVERVQLKRFLKDIGGQASTMFDRSCSHLIHVDAGKEGIELAGLKVEKAKEWGKPIESSEWLRRWAADHAVIASPSSSSPSSSNTQVSKTSVKGKEKSTQEPRDITNEPSPRRRTSSRILKEAEDKRGPLRDCVVCFSNKIPASEKTHFGAIVTKLGAALASTFDASSVTHLIHVGARANEYTGDFKKARDAGVWVVHPQWIAESDLLDERPSETDYPHTLDPKKTGQLAITPSVSPARAPSMSRANSTDQRSPSRRTPVSSSNQRTRLTPRKSEMLPVTLRPSSPESTIAAQFPPRPRRNSISTSSPNRELGNGQLSPPPPAGHAIDRSSAEPSSDLGPLPGALDGPAGRTEGSQRVADLQRTTSALLAQFAEDQIKSNASRGLGRKRSNASNVSSKSSRNTPASPAMSRGPSSRSTDLPRRIPGQAMLEPSQFTQGAGEETYQVEYDDPAEAAAREALALALGGGAPPPAPSAADYVAHRTSGRRDQTIDSNLNDTPGSRTATRSSARKRRIDQRDNDESVGVDASPALGGKRSTRAGR